MSQMCASLIVPNCGDYVLAKSLVILLGADSMPEMIGLKGISSLSVFGRP